MKKILVLGGTRFVGRALVRLLLKNPNNRITIFNRGVSGSDIFQEIHRIYGDRNTDDIRKLTSKDWDVIVDVSGLMPDSVGRILKRVEGRVGRYIYVSTASHYQFDKLENKDDLFIPEDHPIVGCSAEERIDSSMTSYNPRKAECEREIAKKDSIDSIILRPSIVFGPHDYTDRLYYYLYRAKFHDEILVPNNGENYVSATYVRDFAKVIEKAITIENHRKIYNVPTIKKLSIKEIIETASELLGKTVKLTSFDEAFLNEKSIRPWMDIPYFTRSNFLAFDDQKIKEDFDIPFTDLKSSLQETIDFYTKKEWRQPDYGLSREQEVAYLKELESISK